MVDEPEDSSDIKETDIIFDCPHCGKSLAIDYRGAGLTIPCTDCGNLVEVPIPEGMQIGDLDSSEEEQEARVIHLRKSLKAAEERIRQLEAEIEEVNVRRETLEKTRTEYIYQFGQILEKVSVIQKLLKQVGEALEKIADVTKSVH